MIFASIDESAFSTLEGTMNWVIFLIFCSMHATALPQQPNIVMILADDYGWHDIGFHGGEVLTPTLDKLAAEGVRLENYYVQPICTPTRSQLLSGLYQIHTGLQHDVLTTGQDNGLPLGTPTIADKLKQQGYATHLVGKWHIGNSRKEYLPTRRGFDTFYGYLAGHEDYFNHSKCFDLPGLGQRCGLDFWENEKPLFQEDGQYSAHLYTARAQNIIRAHAANHSQQALFLYLPYQSVHDPFEVPPEYEAPYSYMPKGHRRTYLGMVSALDEAVSNVTTALQESGLWENTVLVFSTDNGGDFRDGGGINWPLRGRKWTLWEGGMRGNGFVASPLLKNKGRISWDLMHVSDWFPTFLNLAGGNTTGLALDGFNVWDTLSSAVPSPRKELLHNIDPLFAHKGERLYNDTFDTRVRAAIRSGPWKLITGDPDDGSWYPPPRFTSDTLNTLFDTDTPQSDTHSTRPDDSKDPVKNLWLFNIADDPLEINDLSSAKPDIARRLLDRLVVYNNSSVPCRFPPSDPRADPVKQGGVWGPWL